MSVFNGQTSANGVVTPFLAKSITLTDTTGVLDPITITAGVSANDDMAISVDTGAPLVSNPALGALGAPPSGAGTAGTPYVATVQSMTVFAKNWRLQLVFNTPDNDATLPSVSFYA
jgi:hypothetical protein